MTPFHQKCLSPWLLALCFSFLIGKADKIEDSSAKTIESVVRKYCGKQKGKLTQEDVSKITQIHLWDMSLTNLKGVEKLHNLTSLWLQNN